MHVITGVSACWLVDLTHTVSCNQGMLCKYSMFLLSLVVTGFPPSTRLESLYGSNDSHRSEEGKSNMLCFAEHACPELQLTLHTALCHAPTKWCHTEKTSKPFQAAIFWLHF